MAVLKDAPDLPLLSEYPRFARRHRVVIVALMTLGLLAGGAWSFTHPTTFSATASVSLAPVPKYVLPTGIGLAPPEVSIDTDAQLLYSPDVLSGVAEALGADQGSAISHLAVTASPNSHVLHVTATAPSASAAADAANAAVSGLIRVRRDTLGALRRDQLRLLRLWTAGQEDLLAREQSRVAVILTTSDVFGQVLWLREGLQELEEARLTPAEVVNTAVPATVPDYPNAEVPLASGAMLGLLVGCFAGARVDRRRLADTSVRPERTRPESVGILPAVVTTRGWTS
ncbi:hypothetical protein ASG88_19825 [Nocardioides sp. Soil777]|uniref:hypothetical protein n=1 Tax=Nocardioides sp. Soil777 TaxID=1736409 RepID=UPI000703BFB3|nr:hypothetical protein [Nocardioides sp. Soil777]KRF06406.1 hypothetical protein ASG88_19825 [Nocardioides sp. Soil777]